MSRLPPEWIPLFAAGVSQRLGSCTTEGEPAICRALAADIEADGRVVFLTARSASRGLLDAVSSTRQVAAVMALPSTHQTLHMKGRDATVTPVTAADWSLLAPRRDAFAAQLTLFGFDHAFVQKRWYTLGPDDLVRVVFSIYGAWDQSPGPGAGAAVELLT